LYSYTEKKIKILLNASVKTEDVKSINFTGNVQVTSDSEGNTEVNIPLQDIPEGDFIPLSGTEAGKPVTGDIELSLSNIRNGFKSNYSDRTIYNGISDIGHPTLYILDDEEYENALSLASNNLEFYSNNPLSKGIVGLFNYSPNYDDLTYVQKIYVDNNFLPKPTEGTNGQVLTTDGAGTYTWEDKRPYKVYTALLTQSGTDAPVATVLENTLGGNVTYTRAQAGNYGIVSNNLFGTVDKCIIFLGSNKDPVFVGGSNSRVITRYSDPSSIQLYSLNLNLDEFLEEFGSIRRLSIEIRVYN